MSRISYIDYRLCRRVGVGAGPRRGSMHRSRVYRDTHTRTVRRSSGERRGLASRASSAARASERSSVATVPSRLPARSRERDREWGGERAYTSCTRVHAVYGGARGGALFLFKYVSSTSLMTIRCGVSCVSFVCVLSVCVTDTTSPCQTCRHRAGRPESRVICEVI